MAQPPHAGLPASREITLEAGAVTLSALLAEPRHRPPRAVVVAVHGTGMRAGYFDSRARPGLSLLELGAELGFTVLAVDRPGYGLSAPHLPRGQSLADQSATLRTALDAFARDHPTGVGFFLVAHSNGGKLALTAAADDTDGKLIGLDINGCGYLYGVPPDRLPTAAGGGDWRRHWGALRLYPPDAFRLGRSLIAPVPDHEAREAPRWQADFPRIGARIRVPVRFTFAEQETWWRHDDEAVAALRALLAAPTVRIDRQPHAGHNISLGWAARTYHLRALAFLEECLLATEVALPARRRAPAAHEPAAARPALN